LRSTRYLCLHWTFSAATLVHAPTAILHTI